jgi:hypothetical protein
MKALAVILVCCSPLVIAQTTANQKTESRNTVYGQEFGKPLTISECPVTKHGKSAWYTDISSAKELCFQVEGETTLVPLNGKPLNNARLRLVAPNGQLMGGVTEAKVVNGKLDELTFTTAGTLNQEHILSILTEKYGEPTEKKVKHLENGYGATVDGIFATWELQSLKVTFMGALTLSEGKVVIETPRSEKQLEPKL